MDLAALASEAGRQAQSTHPFGHVASVWVVVMVLQDHHGGDDRHPHYDHDAGKVLTCGGGGLRHFMGIRRQLQSRGNGAKTMPIAA